jgi:hypothetical protein
MNTPKHSIGTFVLLLAVSLVGAFLMLGVDRGGTVWIKFILYLMFFLSISYPAMFYSNENCSAWIGRLMRRNRK